MRIPIVEHFRPDPPGDLRLKVEALAEALQREHPELAAPSEFRHVIPRKLDDRPALHLDDLSEISRLDPGKDVRFYQDRARLRATDGDFVASCGDPIEGYEDYCRNNLGLGSPEWLRPTVPRNRMRIAEACWEDPAIREFLLEKLRRGELAYLHPHMGTFAAWELAALLREETDCPVGVVAPHPRLTKWANNKVAFTETVNRLFGQGFAPRTESAWNLAVLARRVRGLSEQAEAICLKLPDAVGGTGNILLSTASLRGRSLAEIQQALRRASTAIDWRGDRELLVDVWEENVLCSPSVQLWIPPEAEGPPLIEGIFEQITEGEVGSFTGTVPAEFSPAIRQPIVDHAWLLGDLFQRLGYLGRCSFDLILLGSTLENCRLEFIECNGRWGGTSIPMMLMNRIFGDWVTQPFAVQVFHHMPGLERIAFPELLQHFESELYDVRTRRGSLIFYNPGRLTYQAGISVIQLGPTRDQARLSLLHNVRPKLQDLASSALQRFKSNKE